MRGTSVLKVSGHARRQLESLQKLREERRAGTQTRFDASLWFAIYAMTSQSTELSDSGLTWSSAFGRKGDNIRSFINHYMRQ